MALLSFSLFGIVQNHPVIYINLCDLFKVAEQFDNGR